MRQFHSLEVKMLENLMFFWFSSSLSIEGSQNLNFGEPPRAVNPLLQFTMQNLNLGRRRDSDPLEPRASSKNLGKHNIFSLLKAKVLENTCYL